jgi:hypothetical protein
MIHYSCDRCRRPIEGHEAIRYVVKMEIEVTLNVDEYECNSMDDDPLVEMDEFLDQLNDELDVDDEAPLFDRRRYDLCPDCYRKFIKNPLAREKTVPFGFSQN